MSRSCSCNSRRVLKEGHKGDQRAGELGLWGKREDFSLENAWGTSSQCSSTKRTATKKMKAVFSGGENKIQCVRVALGEVYVQKTFFTVTLISHWNNVLRDVVEFPSLVVFQDSAGCWAISRLSFAWTVGPGELLRLPPNVDCSVVLWSSVFGENISNSVSLVGFPFTFS